MTKNLKLILIIFFVVSTSGAIYYLEYFRDKKAEETIMKFGEKVIYQCEEDYQCILVKTEGCCENQAAINKRYKNYWDEKQEYFAERESACPAFPCPEPVSGSPKCVNNVCKLINNNADILK